MSSAFWSPTPTGPTGLKRGQGLQGLGQVCVESEILGPQPFAASRVVPGTEQQAHLVRGAGQRARVAPQRLQDARLLHFGLLLLWRQDEMGREAYRPPCAVDLGIEGQRSRWRFGGFQSCFSRGDQMRGKSSKRKKNRRMKGRHLQQRHHRVLEQVTLFPALAH